MNKISYAQKLRNAFIEYNTPTMANDFLAIVNLDINNAGDQTGSDMLALQAELITILNQPKKMVPLRHK